MNLSDRHRPTRRISVYLLVFAAALPAIGGCSTMFPSSRDRAEPAPISDEESRAQVVDAAKEVVRAADLEVTYANLQWEWCNDQGEPPFRTRVDLAFVVPPGSTGQQLSTQIAATAAAQPGWASGPPPGNHAAGEIIHKGAVWAVIGPGNYPERGGIEIFGECRNMNDHRNSPGADITDEIRGG